MSGTGMYNHVKSIKGLVKFTLRSTAAFMPAWCPIKCPLLLLHKGIMAAYIDHQGIFRASFVHFSFIWLVRCSYYVHKRVQQVCVNVAIFLSHTSFNTVALFVHTSCSMPSQISVIPPPHSTKWTSFHSMAPIMNWKRSHCGLRTASKVLLARYCNSLL